MENKYLVLILVIIALMWFMKVNKENFDPHGVEFVPVGADRYGLRGDLLYRRSVSDYYIRPDRRVRLNDSSGEMYVSNFDPIDEGLKGCKKMQCPMTSRWEGSYDNNDQCYNCSDNFKWKIKMPNIHPH